MGKAQPADKSALREELDALLSKHAVEPKNEHESVVRVDCWALSSGKWAGHFAFLRGRNPADWVTSTSQGATSRQGIEAVLLDTLKRMVGAK